MQSSPRVPGPSDEIVVVGWDAASKPILRFRDELHLPDGARSIVKVPPAVPAPVRPAGWRPTRGERVSMMSWRDVPAGGDPYRGEGVVEYTENAVTVVRLDDGSTRGFNVGDVSPLAPAEPAT
jgi:hypothetical protein